jgi:putative ABC transport system permease protein
MTVKQGLKLVGLGMLVGVVAAFILTRVMASLLIGIALVLLTVAILASYIPALRATRVDPIVALRTE